jgi:hypothetical protein
VDLLDYVKHIGGYRTAWEIVDYVGPD